MMQELHENERILLIDPRGRQYLVTLKKDGEFHTHAGFVSHNELIGSTDGGWVHSTGGTQYLVIRPRLADTIYKMPRGAQVIYPKDIGQILMMADIAPGLRVLESGVGSGALSTGMLRMGAQIIGYEIREDFANRARKNVADALGDDALERFNVQIRDVYEGIDETDLDSVVLDLPEPWNVVKHANDALRNGGVFLAYLPTITQVVTLRDALNDADFALLETSEILERTWHIEGQSVRPDHRMVAHTGFLTCARKIAKKQI